MFKNGSFDEKRSKCFWIRDESNNDLVGYLRLYDLDGIEDGYPLFDLRVLNLYRGMGVGKKSVKWLTDYLFKKYSVLERIVGTTRVDNIAMRKTFVINLFVKEGHFRKDWDSSARLGVWNYNPCTLG